MTFKQILGILLIGILGSCSENFPAEPIKDASSKEIPNRITLEEALNNAEALFKIIEGSTRSHDRRVASVEYFGNSATRGDDDTKYYLVNYEGNSGFAVLSANRNTGCVFAISEEGKLSMEDTTHNAALAYFFRKLNSMATTNYELENSSILQPSLPSDSIELKNLVIIEEYQSPKLAKSVQRWPGTKLSPLTGKYANISISIAQAMTYFKKPQIWTLQYEPNFKRTMNWEQINSYNLNSASSLGDEGLEEIDALISLVENSFLLGNKPIREFDRYAVKSFGDQHGYDIGQLYSPPMNVGGHTHQEPMSSCTKDWIAALKDGRLIVTGDLIANESDADNITSWVVDGYIKYGDNSFDKLDRFNSDTMFHCVWGQGYKGNGYFTFISDSELFYTTPISKDYPFDYSTPLDSVVRPMHYTFKTK